MSSERPISREIRSPSIDLLIGNVGCIRVLGSIIIVLDHWSAIAEFLKKFFIETCGLHPVAGKIVEDTILGAGLLDGTTTITKLAAGGSRLDVEEDKEDRNDTAYYEKSGAEGDTGSGHRT